MPLYFQSMATVPLYFQSKATVPLYFQSMATVPLYFLSLEKNCPTDLWMLLSQMVDCFQDRERDTVSVLPIGHQLDTNCFSSSSSFSHTPAFNSYNLIYIIFEFTVD